MRREACEREGERVREEEGMEGKLRKERMREKS